jgi:hypothetical protein
VPLSRSTTLASGTVEGCHQISGNIGSYSHQKQFNFEAWNNDNIVTHPNWIPGGALTWPTTSICFSGSAAGGGIGGGVFHGDARASCAAFVTRIKL